MVICSNDDYQRHHENVEFVKLTKRPQKTVKVHLSIFFCMTKMIYDDDGF